MQFPDDNLSLIFVCQHTFMFVSLFPLPSHEIHTTSFISHPSVTSIEVKQVYTHTASSLPSITPETHRLTCLLVRQGKHVWLIVRQPSIKPAWINTSLTLWDLAKAIFLNIARNKDTFLQYYLQLAQNPAPITPPPSLKNTVFQK